jgi:hypothetical protein
MGIEELQLEATKLEARELELEAALKETHDLRMLALGVIRGYNLRQQELDRSTPKPHD